MRMIEKVAALKPTAKEVARAHGAFTKMTPAHTESFIASIRRQSRTLRRRAGAKGALAGAAIGAAGTYAATRSGKKKKTKMGEGGVAY